MKIIISDISRQIPKQLATIEWYKLYSPETTPFIAQQSQETQLRNPIAIPINKKLSEILFLNKYLISKSNGKYSATLKITPIQLNIIYHVLFSLTVKLVIIYTRKGMAKIII